MAEVVLSDFLGIALKYFSSHLVVVLLNFFRLIYFPHPPIWTQIFSQRHSFLKFPVIRATKASRASYCLACLISLVEQVIVSYKLTVSILFFLMLQLFLFYLCLFFFCQTRYLQFRKWPVEWGWCRDLQSFIFVFERHNRCWFALMFIFLIPCFLCSRYIPLCYQLSLNQTSMQVSAGTPWIWLCNLLFWAGRILTCWMADQAIGDCYETDFL